MDIQTILIFILSLLTFNLLVVGFYFVLVLSDFRKTLRKTNDVIDDIHTVTDAVSSPVANVLRLVNGVVEGFNTVKSINTLLPHGDSEKGVQDVRQK